MRPPGGALIPPVHQNVLDAVDIEVRRRVVRLQRCGRVVRMRGSSGQCLYKHRAFERGAGQTHVGFVAVYSGLAMVAGGECLPLVSYNAIVSPENQR